MGFDVMGKNSGNKAGEYFRNSGWYWRPLWEYCMAVAPGLCRHVTAQTNDGDGLNDAGAKSLATILRGEIASGRTLIYQGNRESRIRGLPKEICDLCDGSGVRMPIPRRGAGDFKTGGLLCNKCNGGGKVDDPESFYPFSVENVEEFTRFLESCGGFEIW